MAEAFVRQVPVRIAAARASLASGDRADLRAVAHTLKSSSAQLGALRLARLCEAGEQITRGGRLAGVADVVVAGRAELERVSAWLAEALERRSA
jgi:HPt (histidine-containing phosphotransfer) domain-containing protein